MNRSYLPTSAFIDPRGRNRREIEGLMIRAVSLLLPYLTEAAGRPPLPAASVDEEPLLPADPVAEGVLFEKLRPLIAGAMNAAHPGYAGHMNSMPTAMSIVGDLVASALSNNMLFHEISPTFTPLELTLTGQFARLLRGRASG